MRPALSVLCALSMAASGCSFVFTSSTPSAPPSQGATLKDCVYESFAPTGDVLWAGLGVLGLGAAAFNARNANAQENALAFVGISAFTGVAALAAWYGYSRLGECRAYIRKNLPRGRTTLRAVPAPVRTLNLAAAPAHAM